MLFEVKGADPDGLNICFRHFVALHCGLLNIIICGYFERKKQNLGKKPKNQIVHSA